MKCPECGEEVWWMEEVRNYWTIKNIDFKEFALGKIVDNYTDRGSVICDGCGNEWTLEKFNLIKK